MKKISVSIPGCNGRMGKTLLNLILENSKYEIATATCLPNEEEIGVDIGLFVGKRKINRVIKAEPLCLFQNSHVLIDFTSSEATMFHAKECYNNNMSIVIGTTGLNDDQEKELLYFSKKQEELFNQIKELGLEKISPKTSRFKKLIQ